MKNQCLQRTTSKIKIVSVNSTNTKSCFGSQYVCFYFHVNAHIDLSLSLRLRWSSTQDAFLYASTLSSIASCLFSTCLSPGCFVYRKPSLRNNRDSTATMLPFNHVYTIIPQRAYTHTQSLKHTVIASSSLHITKYFIGERLSEKLGNFIHVRLNNSASTEYCIQTMFELHPHSTKSFIFNLFSFPNIKAVHEDDIEFFIAETLCIRSIQYFIEPLNDTL